MLLSNKDLLLRPYRSRTSTGRFGFIGWKSRAARPVLRMGCMTNTACRLLLTTSLLSLAVVACSSDEDGSTDTERAPEGSTQARSAKLSAAAKDAAGCEGTGHIYRNDGDGGAPSTIEARCAAIIVDGTTCAVDPSEVGLSLGLDGHGWTVHASSPCFGGTSLTIAGVDDAPYPQTAVQPFLAETSARLFLTNEGSDASVESGSYSSNPAGSSTIELGPEVEDGEKVVTTVAGVAEVVSEASSSRRENRRKVTFYFAF